MTLEPRIVHVDEWLAVVDKPAGLVVHAARGHRGETLVDALGELLGGGQDPERPGIVHRLDKDTSGLMLVARGDEAHRRLAAQIKAHEVRRTYLALVEGRPRSRSGTIDAPLGRDYRAPERRAVGGRAHARRARTSRSWRCCPPTPWSRPGLETGRTHQIRAHFAAIGHPVGGDPRYGHAGRHGFERQFLHSARLGFRHPFTGEEMEFTSPLPADLAAGAGAGADGEGQ